MVLSASVVTIQGDTVEAKFFARNGPKGWYSHACKSRADQSLNKQKPNTWFSAFSMAIASPNSLPLPKVNTYFKFVIYAFTGPNEGTSASGALV